MSMSVDSLIDQFNQQEQKLIAQNNLWLARVLACQRLRGEGLSLRQIGKRLDLSHEYVRKLLTVAV